MKASAALAAAAAILAIALPALAQDQPAGWLRRPNLQDLMAVYPPGAIERGESGHATIACVVTVQGTLRGCRVISEGPARAGFGSAAIAITPQLLMKPALKGGAPVESVVKIPFDFPAPGPTTGSHMHGGSPLRLPPTYHVYSNIPWSQAPSVSDLVAAYPKKARAEKVAGRSTLNCLISAAGALATCDIINEEPKGYGFAGAARALSGKFQGPVADDKGQPLKGSFAQVLVNFPADYLDNPTPRIGKPRWVDLPTAEDFNAVYPAAAGKAGILKARVVLDCAVAAGGALAGCQTVSEDPPGYGFGAAAASLAGKFRVSTWTVEGLPTIGGRVSLPIRYELPSVPPGK
ncbi:MAG: hypothetical protein JWP49_2808 [Phenylobacterium sp.]|jgi:TonB family protein|nr:hypothetical protein [Phenylobacterium sp.]